MCVAVAPRRSRSDLAPATDSVHFLKSKLCVGCVKGFEIVDLETLDTQGLLDPADSSLDFVQKRENVKPLAIFRIDGEFLLCYDEFAFCASLFCDPRAMALICRAQM